MFFSIFRIIKMNTSQVIHVLNFFYDHADERIRDKFLMGSPYAIIFIYVTYVLIILKILPRFFEDRKPLNYQKIITCLDVVLTMRSSYFLIHGIYLWFYVYDWVCQPNDKSGSWLSDLEVELSHQFVISEFLLIFQSVVCVICKKNDSVATYMLVHHSVVPILLWFGTNYYPGGHGFFLGWVNSIEHTVSMTVRIIYVGFNLTCIKNYVKQFFMCTQVSFNFFLDSL